MPNPGGTSCRQRCGRPVDGVEDGSRRRARDEPRGAGGRGDQRRGGPRRATASRVKSAAGRSTAPVT
ncbi:hypothetical protein, partial [Micromonospora olivasterospora]|uniref:hypothetical protein n=1 Tax=Micromonospora olivasterospora TaxID=1880 RepID=UPI0031DEDBFB